MLTSDFIVEYLENYGIEHCFSVVGGGAIFLNHSFGKSKKIKTTYMHHEQSCAIAAEGYYRASGKIPVVCVTTGPGELNTLTGVMGQWTDSIPCIYISGQVKYVTTMASLLPSIKLRQLGDQETNIVDIVKPLTKYAKMITDSKDIKKELEKALYIATSSRPGPVWLDIPINIQCKDINKDYLYDFCFNIPSMKTEIDESQFHYIIEDIKKSKRTLIVVGHGVRLGNAHRELSEFIDKTNFPVVTTFNGFDLISSDHPNFVGRIGTVGTRAGNFALQNADLILCLGTRNNIRQISYDKDNFGKKASKIIVDIDEEELKKPLNTYSTLDCRFHMDVKLFLTKLLNDLPKNIETKPDWLQWCKERQEKYPVVLEEYYKEKESINPYVFIHLLTKKLSKDAIVIAGNGTACVALFQAGNVKEGQRMFWNSGTASMGYDLPASIGASIATGKEIILITGDGSLMMNLQELQTIRHYKLPIKIFVLNNQGYSSLRQTQNSFFGDGYVGCDENSGISFPNYEKLAYLYGMAYGRLDTTSFIDAVLDYNSPMLCEVILPKDYIFSPKVSSEKKDDGTIVSHSFEDMYPFLSEEEVKSNMIGGN